MKHDRFCRHFITLRNVYLEGDNFCLNLMSINFTDVWKFTRSESVKRMHWPFALLLLKFRSC